MKIAAQYPTLRMNSAMKIQNPVRILFGDHPAEQWASSHQKISSRQHLEKESRQLNLLLHWHHP